MRQFVRQFVRQCIPSARVPPIPRVKRRREWSVTYSAGVATVSTIVGAGLVLGGAWLIMKVTRCAAYAREYVLIRN